MVASQVYFKIAFNQCRLSSRKTESAGFVAIDTIGLLGMHYLVAKSVAAGFRFLTNLILRSQMLFVRRPAL